ncbi:MAG: 50S ribosomal protein L5 [Armatimonadota bacterium]|nr:50S ribosomal protein L5 [Armatimonadota bacterium]MDR7438609.1 50S ribosomal protein L5 [Armatimonadota bacterium]MDR7562670.1 50S ribosomal protein L5 [Armatimonadota bacterium]MDR7567545.1 50S ribosomal protein L5 [Armatimonadota bacterium]MDR7601767.1 50S ribosomal protein L5 [Armatimonadota bacterium]
MVPRLKEKYLREVRPALQQRFGYRNPMEVPRLEKIVLNMRVGEGAQDPRQADRAAEQLAIIAGQKPVITRARKSIAAFKLRKGAPIGVMVTLRGNRMWEFLDRFIHVALPRIKDFRGISERQLDGRGNLNLGIREQLIFPELDYDRIDKIRGMDIAIVTTARTDEEARELLRLLGLPFREREPAAAAS